MNKKIIKVLLSIMLFVSLLMYGQSDNGIMAISSKKAVWLSYIDIEDLLKDKSKTDFIDNYTDICKNIKKYNGNTIIAQVRPFNDAIYLSKFYHWSSIISSANKSPGYDPLKLMIEIAHKQGLSFEAWVNPYRISTSENQLKTFNKYSPIKSWIKTDKVLRSGNKVILNPASADVQKYITNGVAEIVENYDVDGIHMDDYFYIPGTYGKTTNGQRKAYVNNMVKMVYARIKSINKKVTFGISPQGNLENCREAGADIDKWLSSDGYIDYLMPQIYWSDAWGSNGTTKMFSNRVKAWNSIWKNKKIQLFAGLALYKVIDKPKDDIGWRKYNDNLAKQISILDKNNWMGYSLFQYSDLLKSVSQKELENIVQSPIKITSSKTMIQYQTFKPSVTSLNSSITWKSSKTSVATVDKNGKITAKGVGNTDVIAITSGGKKAVCKITVKPVTISILSDNSNIYRGFSAQLKAKTNNGSKVSWKKFNNNIAGLTSTGKLTAKKAGKITITAYTSGAQKNITINIKEPVLILNKSAISIYEGHSTSIKAPIVPKGKVTWHSSNKKIATVDSNGKVKGIKAGKVTVSASYLGKKQSCKITVKNTNIKLNKNSTVIYKGKSATLKAITNPQKAKVKWISGNKKIVTVNSNGVIHGKKAGKTVIYATYNGKKIKCTVSVKNPYIKTKSSKIKLRVKRSYTLKAKAYPSAKIKWTVSNKKIATISKNGKVTGKKKGTTYVYAKANGIKKKIKVVVS